MLLVDVSVSVPVLEEVQVLTTKVNVGAVLLDYETQVFRFFVTFGVIEAAQFVAKRSAILSISGGPVYSQLLAKVVPGTDPLFTAELPDVIVELIEALDTTPSLVDGENVKLEYT